MLTILFLGANPTNATQLSLGKEVREIQHRLRATPAHPFSFTQEWAVRARDLQQCLLRHRPTIVHFSGHGSPAGELILENDDGQAATVRPEAISSLFKILSKDIRGVILNACYSEQQARSIAQHIDFVVGMNTAVEDSAAISFAEAFYQALAFGSSLQEAFDLGCNQITLSGGTQEAVPQLICRTGIDPSQLLLTGQAENPSQPLR